MEKPSVEDIKDKLKPVCICKGIRKARIGEAISRGCHTVEEVNRRTGSGSGGCQGRRCRPVIEAMIEKAKGEEKVEKASS